MAFHSLCALLKGWPYWGLAVHNPDIPVGDMILEPILLAIPGQCVHVKMPRHVEKSVMDGSAALLQPGHIHTYLKGPLSS